MYAKGSTPPFLMSPPAFYIEVKISELERKRPMKRKTNFGFEFMTKLDLRFPFLHLLRFRRRIVHITHLHVLRAWLFESAFLRVFVKLDFTIWTSGEAVDGCNIFAIGCTSYVSHFLGIIFVIRIGIVVDNQFASFFIRSEMGSILPRLPTAL